MLCEEIVYNSVNGKSDFALPELEFKAHDTFDIFCHLR